MASHCYSRRRRVKPVQTYTAAAMTREEEKLLQQAIENSKKMTQLQRGERDLVVPFGPTFFPTVEDFEGSPLDYIEKIRPIAQQYGVCKIVPPKGWNPPFSVDMKSEKKFQTKEQLLHRIQEGISFGDGEEYSASSYVQMAVKQTQQYFSENVKDEHGNPSMTATLEYLEKCYWDIVEISHEEYTVEYGNDVDSHEFGSGFPRSERGRGIQNAFALDQGYHVSSDDETLKKRTEPKFGTEEFYKESYWNLNNIPNCPGSILQYIKVGINGINVPWMYFGNLFSTFCWHNEDNYLYSINYHHWGAPKLWYGVPGTEEDAAGLEQVFKSYLSMKMRDAPDLLHHITTMFSPRLLQSAEVPVYKLIQYPGEFVVTFPMSFHGGFSLGPNVGEAVNFATNDWIAQGAAASERYRSFSRPAVFSHDRLTFTMAYHLEEQKSYRTCKMLLDELKRIMDEEISLRSKLVKNGIRDISKQVDLPRNRFDQLDEDSADYDDKRLCFACKHICFLSCVACKCSKSKVSCLRHSHYMCRCPFEDRFMMVWCTTEEMKKIHKRVKDHAELLKSKEEDVYETIENKTDLVNNDDNFLAPGVLEDLRKHDSYVVNVGESPSSLQHVPSCGKRLLVGDQSAVKSVKTSPKKKKI